ncbi:MAG: succinate dehydrogenase, hydrophobic membrane anchor protein [Deltaproteobacteria bacterium]|nr:succinate dehydrogenase, hydrophobic membrane anchor protein [Deltaproteobacteria bacterium]MBW2077413.1 succinate dehydrogenase, hydrophobic membrane anchor protein [Deltaproteobacteria bacterium]MBW2311371.1 succinate dehydrogenase, hydrophobic membrane anchor protein [Deltaproteobacteria bacterium]
MENAVKITRAEASVISLMGRIPILSYYAHSRGWSFLLSWAHRLAGLTLVGYMFAHIYTLSLLFDPTTFDADMKFLDHFVFAFLEWCVAIPVIFHSLNGSRLILYELFHVREEELMIRSVVGLGFIYVLLVGFFFIEEGPQISATIFWAITNAVSLSVLLILLFKIWTTRNSIMWKLQRITGAFMLPMLIGHMFFMHMNYLTGHDSKTILMRLQSPFIRGLDFVFIVFLLFHAGYGLFSIIADYIKPGALLKSLTILIVIVMALSAFYGIRIVVAL